MRDLNASVLSGRRATWSSRRARQLVSSSLVRSCSNACVLDDVVAVSVDFDGAEHVGAVRGPVFDRCAAGRVESDVDDGAFGGGEEYFLDERLVFVAAAVAADELHPRRRGARR